MKNKKINYAFIIWTSSFLIFIITLIYYNREGNNIETKESSKQKQTFQTSPIADLSIDAAIEHMNGDYDAARIVVIEYSDTECPWCKLFHYKFQEQILKIYPHEVALIYRHFPLPMYPKSEKEAEALECATEQKGNEMFWKYLDEIYRVTPSDNGLNPAELPKIAERLNLDVFKFNQCLNEGRYTEKVENQILGGTSLGIHQTPSVIIWNRISDKRQLISGANSRFLEIKTIIDSALR